MDLIITGASGFIGRNFLLNSPKSFRIMAVYNRSEDFPKFLKDNCLDNVYPIKCNLADIKEVESMFRSIDCEFDICLYMAANSDPRYSAINPIGDLNANTASLLNFMEHFTGKKLIFLSSGAVYDGLSGFVSPKSKLDPKLPYAISKLASEQYIKFYFYNRKTFENYIILRFFGAYGPHEPPRKIYSKLVKEFYIAKKNLFEIYGNGKNYIDAMYIDDMIKGLMKVIKKKGSNNTLDFCVGKPMKIMELVSFAARVFGIKNVRIEKNGKSNEPIKFHASPAKFRKIYGFKPTVKLEEGLYKLAKHL